MRRPDVRVAALGQAHVQQLGAEPERLAQEDREVLGGAAGGGIGKPTGPEQSAGTLVVFDVGLPPGGGPALALAVLSPGVEMERFARPMSEVRR